MTKKETLYSVLHTWMGGWLNVRFRINFTNTIGAIVAIIGAKCSCWPVAGLGLLAVFGRAGLDLVKYWIKSNPTFATPKDSDA